ncbi:MAG: hypothetical protein ACRDWT_01650 [Jatrophihabitantaceae bacterium]
MDKEPGGDERDPLAVPDVYRGPEGRPGPVLFTLTVEGERFAVRRAAGGGTNYDWLSGPNRGYGFGSSGTPSRSAEEHREHIRTFLAMIDPATGYIGDE